ncbi:hypothetical protein BBJ28_00000743, partial [Nothophytophthora sp. Chile5]
GHATNEAEQDAARRRLLRPILNALLAALLDRCSVGHRGKFGHEFMEFEFRADGKLRYANNSNYKKDSMIRKEGGCAWQRLSSGGDAWAGAMTVSQSVIDEVKRIISDSEITK